MKKIATKFSAIALIALALTSCNKKADVAPVADKEFQSSIDASAATAIVTDIDMLVAQASERSYAQFYSNLAGAGANTVTLNRDTTNHLNQIYFNNALCADGAVRNGTVVIDYSKCSTGTITSGGQLYIRNPNHMSVVTFINYSVGKFRVKSAASPNDSSKIVIINTTPAGYSRSVTPLSWSITGSLYLADTTKNGGSHQLNISWINGALTKTLTNSTSNTVCPLNVPINWSSLNSAITPTAINGIVWYGGQASGVTNHNVAYTYVIDPKYPLVRNFGCSPDYYINKEQHPIIQGKVAFTTGTLAPRTIYYGDASNNAYCDNSGIVYIQGISYNIDFWH